MEKDFITKLKNNLFELPVVSFEGRFTGCTIIYKSYNASNSCRGCMVGHGTKSMGGGAAQESRLETEY